MKFLSLAIWDCSVGLVGKAVQEDWTRTSKVDMFQNNVILDQRSNMCTCNMCCHGNIQQKWTAWTMCYCRDCSNWTSWRRRISSCCVAVHRSRKLSSTRHGSNTGQRSLSSQFTLCLVISFGERAIELAWIRHWKSLLSWTMSIRYSCVL